MSPVKERSRGATLRRAATDLAGGLVPLSAAGSTTWWLLDLPASFLLQTLALYGALSGLLLWRLPPSLPSPGLGTANRVTLTRATLALPVIALVAHPGAVDPGARWWVIGVATVAMCLDWVDGRIARSTGTTTAFGGRFDMELDAALLLGLSVLVWWSGQVGAWVVLIGGLRYLFVGAGLLWPPLAAELPPSQRRKTVCVVQGVVLLVCLGPIIPPAAATLFAAGALGLLLHSFGTDVRWLARRAG